MHYRYHGCSYHLIAVVCRILSKLPTHFYVYVTVSSYEIVRYLLVFLETFFWSYLEINLILNNYKLNYTKLINKQLFFIKI